MNILICSKLFYPANEIGAVRVTNLAKFLIQFGHDVTVVSGSSDSEVASNELMNSLNIIRVSHSKKVMNIISKIERTVVARKELSSKIVSIDNKKDKTLFSKISQLLRHLRLQVYTLYLQADWFNQVRKLTYSQLLDKEFDIVISSFGPLGSHLAGRFFKKIHKAKHWIADLRDNMQSEEYSWIINLIYTYFEKDLMRKADAITVVSRGQQNMLIKQVGEGCFSRQNVHVVYNGFEKIPDSLLQNKYCTKTHTDILKIVYTGALYSGKRDMSMLFKAIKELSLEQKIRLKQVQVHYAGKNSSDLYNQASRYGMEEIIRDHGYVLRSDSIRLQESADVLVVLSWNTQKEQGILSGKFFEYIQAGKPIISIVNGNVPGAELSEMVKAIDVGIACELINVQVDLPRLKNYLCSLYNCVVNGAEMNFSPSFEKIQSFQYENVVRKFEEICLNLDQKSLKTV